MPAFPRHCCGDSEQGGETVRTRFPLSWPTAALAAAAVAMVPAVALGARGDDRLVLTDDPCSRRQHPLSGRPGRKPRHGGRRTAGALRWITQIDPNRWSLITSSPIVVGRLVLVGSSSQENVQRIDRCCIFRGSVTALDKRTGRVVLRRYTVPDNGGRYGGFAGAGGRQPTGGERGARARLRRHEQPQQRPEAGQ